MGFHFEYVTQKFVLVRVALLDHFEMLLEEIIAQTTPNRTQESHLVGSRGSIHMPTKLGPKNNIKIYIYIYIYMRWVQVTPGVT